MRQALAEIVRDNWQWRRSTWHLAIASFQATYRGAVLGWVWLVLKPTVFIGCFWFALTIGLRGGHSVGEAPFLAWLACGQMAWLYMSTMIAPNVYRSNTYLVTSVQFPLAVIPSFVSLSSLFSCLASLPLLAIIFVRYRFPLTIYALQLPVIVAVMYLFFTLWSMLVSPVCALSKDFFNFLKVLQTPLFWFSGVIFNVHGIEISWVRRLLDINPVTFFISAMRAALCDRYWVWEQPRTLAMFGVVLVLVGVGAVRIHYRFAREIADVL